MNINGIIQGISNLLKVSRPPLSHIPGLMLVCTCNRRPGLSSLVQAAEVFSEMEQNEYDDILKKFTYNLLDKIKKNIQDDGVCFIAIPPGEMKFQLTGGNAGGPIVLSESPADSTQVPSNNNFIFTYGIIR
jgi:hypothetical protein